MRNPDIGPRQNRGFVRPPEKKPTEGLSSREGGYHTERMLSRTQQPMASRL